MRNTNQNRKVYNYLAIKGHYEDDLFDERVNAFITQKKACDFSVANKYEFFNWYNDREAQKKANLKPSVFMLNEKVIKAWHLNKENKLYYSFEIYHWKKLILFMKAYNLTRITSEKGIAWYMERTYKTEFGAKQEQHEITTVPKIIVYKNESGVSEDDN